jgi:TetR/AcrR family transcriptional repressor of nem operon
MRVTKAQAQANRAHIVETASALFREHGYDGVGVAELMAAAGFTHGGFYKHFRSKADLMAETAAAGLSQSLAMTGEMDLAKFISVYVSREHRDGRSAGCTMAALCGDAARQSDDVKATFAAGIEDMLAVEPSPCRAPALMIPRWPTKSWKPAVVNCLRPWRRKPPLNVSIALCSLP